VNHACKIRPGGKYEYGVTGLDFEGNQFIRMEMDVDGNRCKFWPLLSRDFTEVPREEKERFEIEMDIDRQKIFNDETVSGSGQANKIENIDSHDNHPLALFRAMKDLRFEEITIGVDPDNYMLRISARKINVTVPFGSLGLMKKNQISLNRPGEILFQMAKGSYNLDNKTNKSAQARLSKALREAFGTESEPITKGKPKFNIFVPKDREAEFNARRNTMSYEDGVEVKGGMDSKKWAIEYDPDFDPNDPKWSEDLE